MGQASGAGSLLTPDPTHHHEPGTAARLAAVPPPARNDLAELLAQVAEGDQESFADLYDAIAPRVHGLARRVVRDPAMAEEVTQEVFLQVWREARRFDPSRGSALSWLLTLTHRRAVDRVRAEQAQSDRLHRYESRSSTTPYDTTAEQATQRLEAGRVRRALDGVGEPHRSALELAYLEGLTHQEVAERTGVPLGTAKTRIRDGLGKLRHAMTGGER
ncbi:ECF RNA polymerase sigma factor SigK [Ornithinimicrobium pekingense]|uniref:RNA polymerase sigma factor SigK n=1 Tax=Ornithinimicrobium pekingense TaxID=384677 RepID=A0ABQ2F7X2_9MICO|nr:ECF RNA polymerase sigma factor SigK [Ornithinimicrobium pekingense]GGK69550.1 RNA polymerase sigma factor SigK [Ornithinimicrobium pekingense]